MSCIGGVSEDLVNHMKVLVAHIQEAPGHRSLTGSLRPDHSGIIKGIGWSKRANAFFQPTEAMVENPILRVHDFQYKLLNHIATTMCQHSQGQNCFPMPNGSLRQKTGPNLYLSVDYQSASVSKGNHPPPPQIASLWGVDSCVHKCLCCRQKGCTKCPNCPLHFDSKDTTMTIAMFYQDPNTPVDEQAFFLIENDAHSMISGFVIVFNGRLSLHGVYCPPNARTFYGSALVRR